MRSIDPGPPPAEDSERPALAPDVTLVGELDGGGYVDRQWLIQRGDRFVQVTEMLFRVAERADGTRTLDQIAAAVTADGRWLLTADHVRHLLASKLIPAGIVAGAGPAPGGPAPGSRRDPLQAAVSVRARRQVLDRERIDRVSRILQVFFRPALMVPMILAIVGAHGWLYLLHGVRGGIQDVLSRPGLLLAVVGILVAAGAFHELGHAAALRYGGGRARGMGVGLYLVFPTFYTDLTDGYRLPRAARVRGDLGGVYFHAIVALALIGLSLPTGADFLLLTAFLVDLEILRQFIPFVRLDGYWLTADLVGIPDFFSQIGPFVRSLVPRSRATGAPLPRLRPAARAAFLGYLVVSFLLLPALGLLMVTRLPRIVPLAWTALELHGRELVSAIGEARVLEAVSTLLEVLLLALQVAGVAYFVLALVVAPAIGGWRRSRGRPRAAGLIAAIGGALLVATAAVGWAGVRVGRALSGEIPSRFLPEGRASIALGGAVVVVGAGIALTRSPAVRRAGAALLVGLGVAGATAGAIGLASPGRALDLVIGEAVEGASAGAGSRVDAGSVAEILAGLGLSVSPGPGPVLALAGGLLALGGATAALARRRSAAPDVQGDVEGRSGVGEPAHRDQQGPQRSQLAHPIQPDAT